MSAYRSMLYIPGNSPALLQHAPIFGADSVLLDLEDAVALTEKDAARKLVRHMIEALDFGKILVTVRINGADTAFFERDLEEIVPAHPGAIRLPKCGSPEDVRMIDKLDGALRMHQLALGLRAERQQVLANNIANADTPNFKARDFDFAAELARAAQAQPAAGPQALRTTDARHLSGRLGGLASERELLYRIPGQPSMDGNTVDMDLERGEFADNAMRYQVSLTLMNSRIQGLKTALQPE